MDRVASILGGGKREAVRGRVRVAQLFICILYKIVNIHSFKEWFGCWVRGLVLAMVQF